jgi:hypothetical protein
MSDEGAVGEDPQLSMEISTRRRERLRGCGRGVYPGECRENGERDVWRAAREEKRLARGEQKNAQERT